MYYPPTLESWGACAGRVVERGRGRSIVGNEALAPGNAGLGNGTRATGGLLFIADFHPLGKSVPLSLLLILGAFAVLAIYCVVSKKRYTKSRARLPVGMPAPDRSLLLHFAKCYEGAISRKEMFEPAVLIGRPKQYTEKINESVETNTRSLTVTTTSLFVLPSTRSASKTGNQVAGQHSRVTTVAGGISATQLCASPQLAYTD